MSTRKALANEKKALIKKELKEAKLFAPELFEMYPNQKEKVIERFLYSPSNPYLIYYNIKVVENFFKQFNDIIKFLQKSFIECFVAYKTYIKNNDKDSENAFKYYIQKNSFGENIPQKLNIVVPVLLPHLKDSTLKIVNLQINLFIFHLFMILNSIYLLKNN